VEDTVSQDLLKPVALPPELAKLLAPGPKVDNAKEKPSEDFLAVLDRALADKPAEKPSEAEKPQAARAVEAEARPVADPTPVRPSNGVRSAVETAPDAVSVQVTAETKLLNSHRLEKYHGRQNEAAEVRQVPRKAERVAVEPVAFARRDGTGETVAVNLAADARNQTRKAQAPIAQGLEGLGADIGAATSRKVGRKTGEEGAEETVGVNRKKLAAAQVGDAVPLAIPKAASIASIASPTGKAERAAELMQLHADTGGTKGLADALSIVKNLADKLGLNTAADPAAQAAKSVDLSRPATGLSLLRPAAVHGTKAAEAAERPIAAGKAEKGMALRQSRAESLRGERLGKDEAGQAIQQAADKGRVQVLDQSAQLGKPSLVLESMLAEKSASRGDEAIRKDSLQLVNTAYFTPAAERNTASIPVHLTASQHGNLQQALRSHLANGGNQDIVQQARIIMKDKDSGEIKLILKPESLGEVRIHLQMNEGHIAGTIFVENKEVQAAFEDNLNSLVQAFQDGGLSADNLTVAVDPRGAGDGNRDGQRQSADARSDERRKIHAVRSLENSVATVSLGDGAYGQVNLVV
jgi:flagellar hook-length control protein FliK